MYQSPPPDRPPKPPPSNWLLTVFVLASMTAWALMQSAPMVSIIAGVISVVALVAWALRERLQRGSDQE